MVLINAMSKIALIITGDGGQRVKVFSLIRKTTGLSYSEIMKALESCGPIMERNLFGRDHDEIAATLRVLVSALSDLGASFEISDQLAQLRGRQFVVGYVPGTYQGQ